MERIHPRATTNNHIRRQLINSKQSIRVLAKRFKINPKTVRKWKTRGDVKDSPFGTKTSHFTLTKLEQRIIVKVRRHLKMELDDLVCALKPHIPKINRSNCYRVLVRYRLNKLPKEVKLYGKFGDYLPGYLHIDLAYLPKIGKEKKRYLFVAIDRVTKLVFVMVSKERGKEVAVRFLDKVLAFYPYRLHHILTDNGGEFTYAGMPVKLRPKDETGKELEHPFTLLCQSTGIKHKRIKFYHSWTNGMVERMNGKIKDATVKKFRYENYRQLDRDLTAYINMYNLNTGLRSLKGKTPLERVRLYREERPDKFYKNANLECLAVSTTTSRN